MAACSSSVGSTSAATWTPIYETSWLVAAVDVYSGGLDVVHKMQH